MLKPTRARQRWICRGIQRRGQRRRRSTRGSRFEGRTVFDHSPEPDADHLPEIGPVRQQSANNRPDR